eukprot:4212919-Pyramimonas_sp.AAC.1
MPMQCRWGQSCVVDFKRNPFCGGFQQESFCEGRHSDSPAQCQRNAGALPTQWQHNVKQCRL